MVLKEFRINQWFQSLHFTFTKHCISHSFTNEDNNRIKINNKHFRCTDIVVFEFKE